MKLAQLGGMSTGMVVILSIVLVVPAFTQKPLNAYQQVMLSFSIADGANLPQWCSDLSSVLEKHQARAAVFVSGSVADAHPDCVSAFSGSPFIDIGSQTYSYANLTAIDYGAALDEVWDGKVAVDEAGGIDSKMFRAPYGSTDENVYSLLYRSSILADFSYSGQYNKYDAGQFVKFNIASYDWPDVPEKFDVAAGVPAAINFDNHDSAADIEATIAKLLSDPQVKLVNASDLTKTELTVRRHAA